MRYTAFLAKLWRNARTPFKLGAKPMIPKTLRLQRLVNGEWRTINEVPVTPYSHAGLERTENELRRQQPDWSYNYEPFRDSIWRIDPVYN